MQLIYWRSHLPIPPKQAYFHFRFLGSKGQVLIGTAVATQQVPRVPFAVVFALGYCHFLHVNVTVTTVIYRNLNVVCLYWLNIHIVYTILVVCLWARHTWYGNESIWWYLYSYHSALPFWSCMAKCQDSLKSHCELTPNFFFLVLALPVALQDSTGLRQKCCHLAQPRRMSDRSYSLAPLIHPGEVSGSNLCQLSQSTPVSEQDRRAAPILWNRHKPGCTQ